VDAGFNQLLDESGRQTISPKAHRLAWQRY
jgi:hypothetical protein